MGTAVGRGVVVLALGLALGACLAPGPGPSATPPVPSTTTVHPATDPTPSTPAPEQPSVTSTTASTTTASTGSGSHGLPATDGLEREHRLVQALPHATPHYRIDFTVAADGRLRLVVTLLAVLNNPRDLAGYQAELRRYKAEALEFIAAQGDDPSTYTVAYVPPEAAAL